MTLARASKCNVVTSPNCFYLFGVHPCAQTNGTDYGGWKGDYKFPGPSRSGDEGPEPKDRE